MLRRKMFPNKKTFRQVGYDLAHSFLPAFSANVVNDGEPERRCRLQIFLFLWGSAEDVLFEIHTSVRGGQSAALLYR